MWGIVRVHKKESLEDLPALDLLPDLEPTHYHKCRLEKGKADPQQSASQTADGRGLQDEARSRGDGKGATRILADEDFRIVQKISGGAGNWLQRLPRLNLCGAFVHIKNIECRCGSASIYPKRTILARRR